MALSREQEVTRALVSITDYLISGDDAVDLLSVVAATAVQLLDVTASGVLLADEQRQLHAVAASSHAAHTLELLQLQREEGPCLDCFRTGRSVSVPDIDARAADCPGFADAARLVGVASAHAVPLRLRDQVLGVLGLFGTAAGALTREEMELAEALGHVAGVILVAQRAAADQQQLTEQLQQALDSRIVIEQCKGLLAATGGLDMEQAFRVLRRYARDHNLGLTAVAGAVVRRELPPDVVLGQAVR